ncbi:MAG: hypothetical protein JSS63_15090 [Bacteroidetes bacterium]|nr:hypothetical protein [Bacteroidota bacterium]
MKKIVLALLIFISSSVSAQSERYNPDGILSYYLTFTLMQRLNEINESWVKKEKVKESQIVEIESGRVIDDFKYDRNGRLIQSYYGFDINTLANKNLFVSYNNSGSPDSITIGTEKKKTTLIIFYTGKYPDYLIINYDSTKHIRYNFEISNGRIKRLVNENFKDKELAYEFSYTNEDVKVSLKYGGGNSIDKYFVKNLPEEYSIENDSGDKLVYKIANNEVTKNICFYKGMLISEIEYTIDENGVRGEVFSRNGVVSKRKYVFKYYDD